MRELTAEEQEKLRAWAGEAKPSAAEPPLPQDPVPYLKSVIAEMWSIMDYEADCHARDWPKVNSQVSFKSCPCRLCVFVRAGRGEEEGRQKEQEVCPECNGDGGHRITVPAHDPRCDGSCAVGCPVPVEEWEWCRACGGKREGW